MEFWNIVMWIICMALYAKGWYSRQPFGYIGCFDRGTVGKNISTYVTRRNNGKNAQLQMGSDQSDCTYKCAGQSNQYCGELKSISVYATSSQQPSGYTGCYDQDSFGKITKKILTRFNNGTYCINSCKSYGYRYAGTQVQECKCGNKLLAGSQQATCKIKCPGQRIELCGGEESMSIYDISLIQNTEDSSSMSTTSVSTTSVQTTSVSTTSVPTTSVSTTSVPTTSVPTTSVQTTLVSITSVSTTQFCQDTGRTTDGSVYAYITVPVLFVVVGANIMVVIILLKRKRRLQHDTDAKFKPNENSQSNPRIRTVETDDDYLNASLHGNLPSPAAQNNDNGHLSENDDDYLNASLQGNLPSPPVPNDDNGHLSELLQSNLQSQNMANADNDVVNESLQSIRVVSSAVHEYVDINYDELVSQRVDDHCYSQLET